LVWLCNWVTQLVKLQNFQGMLVTGVRFRFNKFPPSNMSLRVLNTPVSMEFFPIDRFITCWKALDRWWEALANVGIFPIWQTKNTQDDQSGWDWKLKIFFLNDLPQTIFIHCKPPATLLRIKSPPSCKPDIYIYIYLVKYLLLHLVIVVDTMSPNNGNLHICN